MKTTIHTGVMTFDELGDTAKEKARGWYCEQLHTESWHLDGIMDDAKNIGLKITDYDLYRNTINGEFIGSALETAEKIRAEHGEDCDTRKTEQAFNDALDALPELPGHEIERRLCEANDTVEGDFLTALLADYLAMMHKEQEYVFSDASVDENILANEYMFTADGKRFG